MKRDVKVGLFVAALVCGLAAMLLGGGLSSRSPEELPRLQIGSDAAGSADTAAATADEVSAPLPSDLTDGIEPPAEDGFEPGYSPACQVETVDAFDEPSVDAAATDAISEDIWSSVAAADDAPEPVGEDLTSWRDAAPSAGDGPPPVPGESGPAETAAPGDFEEPAVPVAAGAGPEDFGFEEDIAAAPETPKRLYIMKDGESFWTVSKKLFGSVGHYAAVVRENPDVNPRRLRAGQVIAIPEIEGADLHEEFLATPEELAPRSRRPRVYLARDERHVIRPGETLGDISQKYYRSAIKWPHILRANPTLDPKRLRAGKSITIPALTEAPGYPKLPAAAPERARRSAREPKVYLAEDTTYVVRPGDTLEGISLKHYGVRHKWNHMLKDARNAGVDARRLRPGDEIVIPALTE